MATTNPIITTSWAKIVTANDEFTLGVAHGPQSQIAVAVMATDVAPTIAHPSNKRSWIANVFPSGRTPNTTGE